jgi:hypothetical protein
MFINDILTTTEASELWGLDDSTLRRAVSSKKFVEGVDYRKSGKVWLITKSAMIRVYGNLEEKTIKDALLKVIQQYHNFKVEGDVEGDLEVLEYELLNAVNKLCELKLTKLEQVHHVITKHVYDTRFMIGNTSNRTSKDILEGLKEAVEGMSEDTLKNIFIKRYKK